MTFLTLNGTTIRTRMNAADQADEEHRLDRERMFDGTIRMTRAGVFRKWSVSTAFLTSGDRDTVRALVNGGSILTASGDLIGSDTPVMPVPGTWTPVQTGDGQRWQGKFALMETGGPLPPDRTAVPFLFLQRGRGYWQDRDNSKATPALDGDPIYTWADQSGNGRDGQAYSADFEGADLRPVRDGDEVRFGVGMFSDPGAGSGRTLIRFDTLFGRSELHMMCGLRAALDPPATSGRAGPFSFAPGGASSGTRYPDTDGHIYINFGFERGLDAGNPSEDLTSFHVLTVSSSATTRQIIAKLDNTVILSYNLVGAETIGWASGSGFPGALECLGIGSTHGWEGWFRDLFIADGLMTPAQERSWYDYIRGATTEPPLPI